MATPDVRRHRARMTIQEHADRPFGFGSYRPVRVGAAPRIRAPVIIERGATRYHTKGGQLTSTLPCSLRSRQKWVADIIVRDAPWLVVKPRAPLSAC